MPADNDLHKAAHKGDLDACKMLIESTVDEDTPITVNDLGASDRRPLHRAAGAGHLEICLYFLEIGADVNAVSDEVIYFTISRFFFYNFVLFYNCISVG